jgi:predicted lipid-binding transport protein (Tim44 family)
MESVAYGGIAISVALLAIVSSVLFVNWRKATAAKRQGVESETKPPEVIGDSAVVKTRRTPEGGDSQPSKASDTASSAPELAQSSMSDANIARSRDESGVSKSKAGSDTAEEYVTLPI